MTTAAAAAQCLSQTWCVYFENPSDYLCCGKVAEISLYNSYELSKLFRLFVVRLYLFHFALFKLTAAANTLQNAQLLL